MNDTSDLLITYSYTLNDTFLLVYFPFILSQIHSNFHSLAAHNSTWILNIIKVSTVTNVLIAPSWLHVDEESQDLVE